MRSLRFALFFAALLTAQSLWGAISGVVMTSEGVPLPDVRIELLERETTGAQRRRLLSDSVERVPLAATKSDSKGTFSFESPEAGTYELAFVADGYGPIERTVEHDEDLGAIPLTKTESKAGTIAVGGQPLAGATVFIQYGAAEFLTRTDAKGRYSAPDLKKAFRMIIVHPETGVDDFRSPGLQGLDRTRTIARGTKLKGRVVAADGETPVEGAAIEVDQWPLARTADDGTFEIPLAPARWQVITASSGNLIGRRAATGTGETIIRLEKAATVSGRVTDARENAGIGDVAVSLIGDPRSGDSSMQDVVTDAKGAFSLVTTPGVYRLGVSHPAFARSTKEVTVTSGQQLRETIAIKRLARISGTVLDERREPVAAVSISPEDAGSEMARMQRFRFIELRTMSGPDGRYAIRVIPDDELLLRATRPGYPEAKSEAFKLTPGERKSGLVLTIPTGIAVTGRVTDADGNPLPGIIVAASESRPGNAMLSRTILRGLPGPETEEIRTADDGTYTYRVKEGIHDFTFSGEGWATRIVRGQEVSQSAPAVVDATMVQSVDISGRVTRNGAGVEGAELSVFVPGSQPTHATSAADGSFTLAGLAPGSLRVMVLKDFTREQRTLTAPSRDVVIELPAGSRVSGRVTEKTGGNAVREFKAGVSMSRSGGGRVFIMPPELRSFTSEDGTFTLEAVPPGAMTIVAEAPGYAAGRANVTIEEGKDVENIELALEAAVKLIGRVTGPNGTPLTGATVRPTPPNSSGPIYAGNTSAATTGATGEYSLDGLNAGEMSIVFSHPEFATARKSVTLQGRETRLDAQLAAGIAIRGVVVTESGVPVADAEVEAMGQGGFDRVRSGPGGEFEFKAMEPGRYRFMAEKSGFTQGMLEDVEVTAGSSVRIELASGATLYGRVLGLSPEEYAHTTVHASGGRARASAVVDSSGNYKIQGAPSGSVMVGANVSAASGTGRASEPRAVELAAGSSQQHDIEFRSDIVIEGRVTRDGQPMPHATVSFAPHRGSGSPGGYASTQTDQQGTYRVTGVSEGDYMVVVFDSQRYFSHSTDYEIRGSSRFDIPIATTSMRGRVIDLASGEPLNDVAVELRSTDRPTGAGASRTSLTDVAGTFLFDSVVPGNYTLSAVKTGYGTQPTNVTIGSSGLEGVEIILSRTTGVVLRVIDARNGAPAMPFVAVFNTNGSLVFDARGRSSFGGTEGEVTLPLAPGSYVATVGGAGLAPRTIALQAPGTQSVSLTPGGQLHVRSKHATAMQIVLLDASGIGYPRFGSTPPYRQFLPGMPAEISHITPGTYTVQVIGPDNSVVASTQVTIQEGQITTAEL